jgi:cyclopropane-fatty-acyl-phospholipid synthase
MSLLSALARRGLGARLTELRHGRVALLDAETVSHYGDPDADPLEIVVLDRRFYTAVAFGGAVGAGEAYANGWWSTDDLTGVVRLLLRNRELLEDFETGWARLAKPLRRIVHALRRNTRRGSRRNISAHYDLGNEFFATFLDDTLTYSCGLFERPGSTLREASIAKYDRIAALADLRPEDHVIEIGTGWGGFAIHAASRYGCRVTTTTISEEQFRLARQRVADAGLADRVTVLQQDYRDLDGTYDKLVSIEMIEAVGHEHFGTFFSRCAELLAPHGLAAIQAITIDDARYEAARREVDFIKRHIFPGACLPSLQVLRQAAARTDLRVERADEIGLHYAETLRRWRLNLQASRGRLAALGLDDRFQRLWEFYFCYCEGGFLEHAIGDVQMLLAKPGAQPAPALPVPDAPAMVSAA